MKMEALKSQVRLNEYLLDLKCENKVLKVHPNWIVES